LNEHGDIIVMQPRLILVVL